MIKHSLENLIEMCGDRFVSLTRFGNDDPQSNWEACGGECKDPFHLPENAGHWFEFQMFGATATEAVSRLLYALNSR